MSEAKWELDIIGGRVGIWHSETGARIAEIDRRPNGHRHEEQEIGQRIVRAVNSHDQLVAALKDLLEYTAVCVAQMAVHNIAPGESVDLALRVRQALTAAGQEVKP